MKKVRLMSEFEVDYALKECNYFQQKEASIAEALADKIPLWRPYDPIVIWAPTGSGKTYFIIHYLIPFVVATGGRLLLVSNRIASSIQQKMEVAKILKHPIAGCPGGPWLQQFNDFGSVRVMTLQGLQGFLNNEEGIEWCKGVTHVVIDEAHFFTSDFGFNHWTGWLLQQIPKVFDKAVRLYMTATPEEVLLPLIEAEQRIPLPASELYRRRYCFEPCELGIAEKRQIMVHKFDKAYDHVRLRYFRDEDAIIQTIQTTPAREKWLIFVNSVKQGKSLKERLAEKIGKENVCMVTANDKESTEWATIVDQEKLPCQVTMATSVLDCGANVNDNALRHLVIYSTQHTEFMQELGRKRCKEGETFTLYVPVPDPKYLSRIRGRLHRQLDLVQKVIESSPEDNRKIFSELWSVNDPSLKAMVWPGYDRQVHVNRVAAHAVGCQTEQLDKLEKMVSIYGDEAFPRLVHEWLHQKDGFDDDFWLEGNKEDECRVALQEYLEEHCNKPLGEDEQKHLRSLIVNLMKFTTGREERKNRQEKLKHVALNNRLEELQIPFLIFNEKGMWTIRKHKRDDAD